MTGDSVLNVECTLKLKMHSSQKREKRRPSHFIIAAYQSSSKKKSAEKNQDFSGVQSTHNLNETSASAYDLVAHYCPSGVIIQNKAQKQEKATQSVAPCLRLMLV